MSEGDGEHTGRGQHLAHQQALAAAVDEVLGKARRTVRILAPRLDIELLNRTVPLETLAGLTRSRHARVRVLLEESGPAVRTGHGLIDLAQRFPSFIGMRLLGPEDRGRRDAWIVVDESAVVYRPDHQRLADGYMDLRDPSRAPKLARDFDEWWERGEPDPNLRRLYI
jgi:hypothetical protein